jgi:hypothetical protein
MAAVMSARFDADPLNSSASVEPTAFSKAAALVVTTMKGIADVSGMRRSADTIPVRGIGHVHVEDEHGRCVPSDEHGHVLVTAPEIAEIGTHRTHAVHLQPG